MIKKDNTILELIERLRSVFDFNLVQIVDYWDSDLCAIGFKKSNKLIYISTFNYVNIELKYDYDLETIDDANDYNVVKEGRAVSIEELIKDMQLFFKN